jgi:hypothetical protein
MLAVLAGSHLLLSDAVEPLECHEGLVGSGIVGMSVRMDAQRELPVGVVQLDELVRDSAGKLAEDVCAGGSHCEAPGDEGEVAARLVRVQDRHDSPRARAARPDDECQRARYGYYTPTELNCKR